jgi:hypothetical protein
VASTRAHQQHGLPEAERPVPAEQHPPGGQVGDGQRRRLLEAEARRDRQPAGGGHGDELGEGAVPVLAGDAHALAEGLLAAQAFGAAAAEGGGVEQHAVAGGEAAAGWGRDHLAGAVQAEHQRQGVGNALAAAHVEVHAVQRRGAQAHQRLAGPGDGVGEVPDARRARAVVVQHRCAHRLLSSPAARPTSGLRLGHVETSRRPRRPRRARPGR